MPVLRLDGDAAGAVKATTDVSSAARKLSESFKEVGDTTEKAGHSHQEAFGPHALQHLVQTAAATLAIHKAVEIVNEALKKEVDLRKELAEHDKAALTSFGQLSAAGGTSADVAFARKLQSKGLVSTDEEAARATTGIVKARLTDREREFAFNLAERRDVDPAQIGEFSENIKAYQERFGGSFEQDSAKIFAAAKIARQSPEEIAVGISKLAKVAKEQGISPDQALATYTTLMRSATTRKQAIPEATSIFEGKADLGDFGADMAATYAGQLQAIQGAPDLLSRPNLTDTDPRLRSAKAAERAEAGEKATLRGRTSEQENAFATAEAQRRTRMREKGANFYDMWTEDFLEGVRRRFGGMDRFIKSEAGRDDGDSNDRESMKEYLRRQTEIMESEHRSVPPPSGLPANP